MSFENEFIEMAKEIARKSGGKIIFKIADQSFRLYNGEKPLGRSMEIYAIFAEEYDWEKAVEMFKKECGVIN